MTGDSTGVVETCADGRVLTIHIDRREKHSAMTPAMFEQFGDAYHDLETNPDRVAALILTSPGTFPGTKPKRNYKSTSRGKIKPPKLVKDAIQIIDKNGPDSEEKLSQANAGLIFDDLLNSGMMGGIICKGSDLALEVLPGGSNFYANHRILETIKNLSFERRNLPRVPTLVVGGSCDFQSKENAQLYIDVFGGTLIEIEASGHGLLENRHLVDHACSSIFSSTGK